MLTIVDFKKRVKAEGKEFAEQFMKDSVVPPE